MKRFGMIAVAAALTVAASWWLLGDGPRAATARDAASAGARSEGPTARPRPPVLDGAVRLQAPPAAGGRPVLTDEIRGRLDESVARLGHAARGCLKGHTSRPHAPGEPDETMDRVSLRVKVAAAGGEAAVADIQKIEDGFADEALERCVLDAMRAARWETAFPDGAIGLEHTFYVGDLVGPDPLAPPRRAGGTARLPPPPPPPPLPGIPPPALPPPPGTVPR